MKRRQSSSIDALGVWQDTSTITTIKEAGKEAGDATARAKATEHRVKAKNEIGKWLDVKNNTIQWLKGQLAHQQDQTNQQIEQVHELEEYISIQENYFADQMSMTELQKEATQEAHEEEKRHLESVITDLRTICTELEVKYEKKWLELQVAKAKLMQIEGSTNMQIAELRKELVVAQYQVSMGEEKVWLIIKAHKSKY